MISLVQIVQIQISSNKGCFVANLVDNGPVVKEIYNYRHHMCTNVYREIFIPFPVLSHLSQRLNWAFLIKICPMSVVFVVVFVVVVTLYIFIFFSRFTGQISTKLGTKHTCREGDLDLFKWRNSPFYNGRELRCSENTLTKFKNLLLKNHWPNFNKIWRKAYLGEVSNLFKGRTPPS